MLKHITHLFHQHFLLVLFCIYILATVFPQPGLWLAQINLLHKFCNNQINITLPMLMLALLLLNAGVGIKAKEVYQLLHSPTLLITGLISNFIGPVLLMIVLREVLYLWHNNNELQNLLVGIGIIAAMPIAGSSAAWSQNSNGNLSLSLGLVLCSTLFSPLMVPITLNIFGTITTGEYSRDLQELATQGTSAFMLSTVVLPSLIGIAVHFLLGEQIAEKIKPLLKLFNLILLTLLNYSNAAISLPKFIWNPDWDFLAFVTLVTSLMCVVAFTTGWLVAHIFRVAYAEKISLIYGLGMKNNGTGIVLASIMLADHPAAMLPMIFYILAQQIIAAVVDCKLFKGDD